MLVPEVPLEEAAVVVVVVVPKLVAIEREVGMASVAVVAVSGTSPAGAVVAVVGLVVEVVGKNILLRRSFLR
jgi:hypothetical protein